MGSITEGRHAAEFVLSEGEGGISRDSIKIAASQTIKPGTVLGKRAVVAGVTIAQSFAGTGDGVLTFADPAVSSKVKDGVYTAVCTVAAADGGRFRVEDPDGKHVGDAVVGAAFNKEIKFTIADGAADFAVGDRFDITVAANADDFEYGAHDPAAADGLEVADAIALYGATTGVGESATISGITRLAEVNGNLLTWDGAITSAQKADAIQALEAKHIIVR